MRILIDFSHPVHVHMFKNFIWEMEKKGHKFLLIGRDKDVTQQLLDAYKFKYVKRRGYKGIMKFFGMFAIDWKIYWLARKFKPDLLIGEGNPYIAQVGWLLGKPSYVFDDTEHAWINMAMLKPFATKIFTPQCYTKDLGKKQVRYNGYKELMYLHPKWFKPDPGVLKEQGIKNGEKFFFVRFVDWQASHDLGKQGIRDKAAVVELLEQYGRVIVNSEKELPVQLKKYSSTLPANRIHDLMSFAQIYIGEGSTMAAESAMLGVPAIYINELPLSYINDLQKANLVSIIHTQQQIKHSIRKLSQESEKSMAVRNRDHLLVKKMDVTSYFLEYLEQLSGKGVF
jgi:uncharacterized protein